jgi:hypothetical protein
MPESRLYFGDAAARGVTASNLGTGTGLYSDKIENDLQFKSLIAGENVTITSDGQTVTISATDAIGVEGGINLGTGEGVFKDRQGSNLTFKSLIAGENVSIVSDGDSLTISATDAIGVEGATNLGTGEGLFSVREGSNLEFKSLVAGTNISLSSDADSITISATGVGENNTASNIGLGQGLFAQKVGVDLEFKSLIGDEFIEISSDEDSVYLSIPVIYDLSESISFLQSDVNILNTSVSSLQTSVSSLQAIQGDYLLLDGTRAMTGPLNLSINRIINVDNPTDPQDAATKAYVDFMTGDISALTARVEQLEADVIIINENLGFIQTDLNSLQGQILSINLIIEDIEENVLTLATLQSSYLLLDGSRAMTGVLNLDGFNISNVADPVSPQDVVTKSYLESVTENVTASNIGTGVGVFASKVDSDLQFKSFIAGSNISVTSSENSIVISSIAGEITASNVGAIGEGIFKQKTGDDLEFKKLIAGNNITLTSDADSITIESTGVASGVEIFSESVLVLLNAAKFNFSDKFILSSTEANQIDIDISATEITASNVGSGFEVFKARVDNDLQFRTIVPGLNIDIVYSPDGNSLSIDAPPTQVTNFYEFNGFNLGSGSQVFESQSGDDVFFRTLVAGDNVTITQQADTVTISSTGGGGSAPDATETTKGILQLSGDLAGTADSPTVPTKISKTGDIVTGNYLFNPSVPSPFFINSSLSIDSDSSSILLMGDNPPGINPQDPSSNAQASINIDKISLGSYLNNQPGVIPSQSNYLDIYSSGLSFSGSEDLNSSNVSNTMVNVGTTGFSFSKTTQSPFSNTSFLVSTDGISMSVDFQPFMATLQEHLTTKKYVDDAIAAGGGGGGSGYADIAIGPSLDIDWTVGTTYYLDITGNANFTFSNIVDGKTITVVVNNITLTNYVASFPSTKQGPGGLDNNVYASSSSIYTFTRSGGVTYCSSISGVV